MEENKPVKFQEPVQDVEYESIVLLQLHPSVLILINNFFFERDNNEFSDFVQVVNRY